MSNFSQKIEIDISKTYLSSQSITLKTEGFLSQTKFVLGIDSFLSKIAQNVIKNFDHFFCKNDFDSFKDTSVCFKVETDDKVFSFLIKFGFQMNRENPKDIIFFDFSGLSGQIKQNDLRVKNYLDRNKTFCISISPTTFYEKNFYFEKLYRLSGVTSVNFPMLTKEQLSLVSTEDKNVIVQGVAGSGKTNVCIEKLIWTASKNYSGRVLYTTFSRGLLNDTKIKVESFEEQLTQFLSELKNNQVEFLDEDKKSAIENYLGIFFFVNEDDIVKKIENMILFFERQVDYFLIEDLYKKYFEEKFFAKEDFFVKDFLGETKNHQILGRLAKLKDLSYEIIYKEVFGLIFGVGDFDDVGYQIGKDEYITLRKNSFDKYESDAIYDFAMEYKKFLLAKGVTDNNFASRIMLENISKIPRYSLVIADEVQDFSQINLVLFRKISLKMFCAGDALQMINPTYFSFSYLKNLLFEENLSEVKELQSNYRNTKKIQEIISGLEDINVQKFGTHNFVTIGKGVQSNIQTMAVYCEDKNFLSDISQNKYDNFTIVVSTKEEKQKLREILKNQEILTVAEIKGLERDVVLLYNLLSDNIEKWERLDRTSLNKKEADENSVFRYYFNLFYVGVTRAKNSLFVVENGKVSSFENFFKKYFDCFSSTGAIKQLSKVVSKIEYTQKEYLARINEFIKLEQYDNALFTVEKLTDDFVRRKELVRIDIYKNYVHIGKYLEAGIKFWENGIVDDAKRQFLLSGDKILIDLIEAVNRSDQSNLSFEIVKYFLDVKSNPVAVKFILDTLLRDVNMSKENQKEIAEKLKKLRK